VFDEFVPPDRFFLHDPQDHQVEETLEHALHKSPFRLCQGVRHFPRILIAVFGALPYRDYSVFRNARFGLICFSMTYSRINLYIRV
jgi:hypothetical protein